MWLRSLRFDLCWLILPLLAVLVLLPLDQAAPEVIAALGLGSLLVSGVFIASHWTLQSRYVHLGWGIMIGSVLLSMWDLSLFMSVYVYWGLWHFARQYWGIAMLYKGRVRQVGTVQEIQHTTDPVVRQFIEGRPTIEEEEPVGSGTGGARG